MNEPIDPKIRIRPRGIPFRCVVCNSFGTLKYGSVKCHACDGKGYILVPNDEEGKDE